MNKAWILVALTGSVATAVACSSSSTPATPPANDDAGSSSGATPDAAGIVVTCKGASDCKTSGDICCGVLQGTSFSTVCQSANCTPILGMPAQGCTTDAECRGTGNTCQSNAILSGISPGAKVCTPSAASGDGGATDSGATTDSGAATDAASTTDAAADAH